ncbi:MAG: hypothetical protein V7711_11290 [Pseudomonadales bacterium]
MRRLICILTLLLSAKAYSDLAVVVAKDALIDSLSEQQVANLFLSKTNRFPHGERAIPIEIKNGALRDGFYQRISGKTSTQLSSYWATLVFTGKGKPARGYQNLEELSAQLEAAPGSISYLPDEQVTQNMKVVYHFD